MSTCGRCGATLSCAMADPGASHPCWCTELPPVVALPGAAGGACWCRACLQQHIDARQAGPSSGGGSGVTTRPEL